MRFLTIITFILFFAISSFGQQGIMDSLKVEAKRQYKNAGDLGSFFLNNAVHFYEKSEFVYALECDRLAWDYFVKAGDIESQAMVQEHIGDIHFEINDFASSLEYYLNALSLFEKQKNWSRFYQLKQVIGDLYVRLDRCETAFKELESAYGYYKSNAKDSKELIGIISSLGIAYGSCGDLDSALYFLELALDKSEKPYTGIVIGGILNNIGAIYSKKGENEKALLHYNQSLELFKRDDIQEGIGVSLSNIAYIRSKEKQYVESVKMYKEALAIFRRIRSLIYLRDNYLNLSDVYQKMNDTKNALNYNNLYLELNDSIMNSEVLSRIGDLQIQYEIKKKDQEILIANQQKTIAVKQKEITDKENSLYVVRMWLLAGGAVLSLIIATLVVRNLIVSRRNTELKAQILEKEKVQLTTEVELKSKELEGFALSIVQKNEMLEELKVELKEIASHDSADSEKIKELSQQINNQLYIDRDRKEFEIQLDKAYHSFFAKLDSRFPNLTKNERRLCSLIVMELSTKDIASILNISIDGVKKGRYRLRKKLELDSEMDVSIFLKTL